MRDELEAVLDLYEGMPLEGQEHWCARSLPSVRFESEAERQEFIAALRERDKERAAPAAEAPASGRGAAGVPQAGANELEHSRAPDFQAGQRVKVNLANLQAGGVTFSQNVEAAFATIRERVSADPAVYRVELLISFKGVREVEVPADRIRPL